MFSPQFASAISAIGAFTNTLSHSVFGAAAGTGTTGAGAGSSPGSNAGYAQYLSSSPQQQRRQQQGYTGYPYPSSQTGNNGGTPSASLMSIDLEESFAV